MFHMFKFSCDVHGILNEKFYSIMNINYHRKYIFIFNSMQYKLLNR